jgi:hypothetical protein
LAISQSRARTCSRLRFSRRSCSVSCCTSRSRTAARCSSVGADTRFGFGVGGGVWVETGGFGGTAVSHGSREDQVGKGYFLIRDGVADLIFRHRWLRFFGKL